MELSLAVDATGDSGELDSLVSWLRESELGDVSMERTTSAPRPGELGVNETLSVVLAAPTAVVGTRMLVQSIHEWIKTRVKATSVRVKRSDGTEIELSTSSTDSDDHQALMDKATILAG